MPSTEPTSASVSTSASPFPEPDSADGEPLGVGAAADSYT
jgi:hypothetical protein